MQLWSLPRIGYHPIDLDGLVEGVYNIAPQQGNEYRKVAADSKNSCYINLYMPKQGPTSAVATKTLGNTANRHKNGISRSCEYLRKQVIFDGKRRVATVISQYYC